MTQQEKDKKIKEIKVFCDMLMTEIESRLKSDSDRIYIPFFQLIAAQNEIIILMLTPVTNDIQNPLHY